MQGSNKSMVSDSKRCRAHVVTVQKTASCSLSNEKSQANTSKKIHKAEREKLKRGHLNQLFQELSHDLDPLGQNSCKTSILEDATRALRDLLGQLEKLKEEHTALMSESRYITLEMVEIKDENLILESEIGMLQKELNQRLHCSGDDTRLTLAQPMSIPNSLKQHSPSILVPLHQDFQTHGDTRPAPLVQRPHARYPSLSESWPAKLLSSIPSAREHKQQQDPQLSCTSSSTLTSSGGGVQSSGCSLLG